MCGEFMGGMCALDPNVFIFIEFVLFPNSGYMEILGLNIDSKERSFQLRCWFVVKNREYPVQLIEKMSTKRSIVEENEVRKNERQRKSEKWWI